MDYKTLHRVLNFGIALVWGINGLFCKILNLVPRHQQIVAKVLGAELSKILTIAIGIAEIAMAIWIISRIWSKLTATLQIIVVAVMNLLEFILVPELLLWGRFNIMFAALFIFIVYYNEFVLGKKIKL